MAAVWRPSDARAGRARADASLWTAASVDARAQTPKSPGSGVEGSSVAGREAPAQGVITPPRFVCQVRGGVLQT